MLSTCTWINDHLSISLKSGCLTLGLENGPNVRVYSFDYAGRLWTSLEDGRSFRHGLDGRTLARWKDSSGRQVREWLPPQTAGGITERARALAGNLLEQIRTGHVHPNPPISEPDLNRLAMAARYSREMLESDRREFSRLYRTVGILPPDQYMAVMLQLTEGCSFNTCLFCTFYKDQMFRVKSINEFREHALQVRDYLREGISLRKTIFLGSANALALPVSTLIPYLEIVHQVFDVKALGGIFAFMDGFNGEKKSTSDFRSLASLGVDTLYIGLESGSDELLRFLNKPSSAQNVLNAVEAAKSAGIRLAVIVLLGPGGQAFVKAHIRDTIAVINRMSLDAGDILYFSKMTAPDGMVSDPPSPGAGRNELTEAEQEDQWRAIEAGLKFDSALGIPRISVYDIRDFIF